MADKDKNLKDMITKLGSILELKGSGELTEEDICNECIRLKQERDRYYRAMDNSADSFHIVDKEGNIIFVNKKYEEKTKSRRKDIIGKNVIEMEEHNIYKPSAPRLALQEGRTVTVIQEGVSGDALATATPIADENGEIDMCISNVRFLEELTLLNKYFHEKEIEQKRKNNKEIFYNDEKLRDLYEFARQIAKVDSSILITGETGTGKSLIAKYIHDNSERAENRFVELNCASIPENLIESELFGYDSGAFTGAKKGGKPGLFELADKGTLFLDEIGDMPMNLQVKLLSVIQNKTIVRIGGTEERKIDVRIITATNRNLEEMIEENAFRSDLYYRINVVPLYMPALRERKGDISNFAKVFLDNFNKKYIKDIELGDDTIRVLNQYSWPGNIRELENLIERLVVTAKGSLVQAEDLPNHIKFAVNNTDEDIKVNRIIPLKEALEKTERQLVELAFKDNNSTYKAAELLQISQSGASRKYLKYIKNTEK